MNFLIKKATFFSLLVLTLFACEKPGDIGLDIKNPGQSFGVIYTDTITVQTSTVLIDSVRTSRASDNAYLLSGQYIDPQLGTVTARSFFQIYPATDSILNLGETPVADSVVLFLRNSYVYGDTNAVQPLNVHLLQNRIEERVYYSTESIPLAAAVGTAESLPGARIINDTLRIRLAVGVGNQLTAANGQNRVDFRNAFNGFAMVPQAGSNGAVLSFNIISTTSRLRLYYHNTGSQTPKIFDFLVNENNSFNQLISSKNAPWTNLAHFQPVPSSVTSQETVVQAGIGLMTKVEIPYLAKLAENRTIRLNQAYLIVEPVQSKTVNTTTPPMQLILYRADANGRPTKNENRIYVPIEEFSDLTLVGSPRISGYNPADKLYRFNITQYLQRILDGRIAATNGFYLSLPSFSLDAFYQRSGNGAPAVPLSPASALETSVSRLILGDQQHPTNRLKLQIYYTEIK